MEREFYRRDLPHWHRANSYLLLTMRLAGSLPAEVARQLLAEQQKLRPAGPPPDDTQPSPRQQFARLDACLDTPAPTSPRWLARADVAHLVLGALRWRAERGAFALLAACVMSNHLHAVIWLPEEEARQPLYASLRDFKQYTAGQANKLLGRTGPFWQPETHDHVIRDALEGGLRNAIRYVCNNPVSAGLCADWHEWPHTYCDPEWAAEWI